MTDYLIGLTLDVAVTSAVCAYFVFREKRYKKDMEKLRDDVGRLHSRFGIYDKDLEEHKDNSRYTFILINDKINQNAKESESRDEQLRQEFSNRCGATALPKKNRRSSGGNSASQKPKVESTGKDGRLVHPRKKAVRKGDKNKQG
jgi:hypothetical protein